ncbi:MAG: hypothetical protein EXR76_16760 [Myxococcales bacterium]|nr:hypothetical protein [Myxococcales bacterium]
MRARAWTHRGGLFVALLFAHNSAGGCSGRSTAALYDGPRLGEPEYRLGVADVIAVDIKENPTFSATQAVVRPDGHITLPVVNDVKVVGLTPTQVRAEVIRR